MRSRTGRRRQARCIGQILAAAFAAAPAIAAYAQAVTPPAPAKPAAVVPAASPAATKAPDAVTGKLIEAIQSGDAARVASLVAQGADVNAVDANHSTPLMQAAAAGSPDVVRALVEKGADVKARDRSGFSPLLVAAYAGHVATVEYLLGKGADPNDADQAKRTALMGAAYSGKEAAVQLLLDKGADVHAADKDGFTALMIAAGNGNVANARLLLDKGADVNAPTRSGFTPLMQAAGAGRAEMTQLLLDKGADVNARAARGASPLLVAAYAGSPAVVGMLLEKGADVAATDALGHTPLIGAAYSGSVPVARLLLGAGADLSAQTRSGLNALMQAAYSGRTGVAALLLEQGAPVDARSGRGLTALMQAVGSGNAEIARLLLDHGADVDAADDSGQTPAVWAKKRGHDELLPLLKAAGASVNGAPPADLAAAPLTPSAALRTVAAFPPAAPDPRPALHGPRIVGCSPGRPFLYRISATGKGPLTYSASGLPSGLTLDAKTGLLTGRVAAAGTYAVTLGAAGPGGKAAPPRPLKIVCGKGKLALTPPMGWSAWDLYGDSVTAEKVRLQADWLVKTGLAAHGFRYVLLDDAWQGRRDPQTGELPPNKRLGDIKALADYLHASGLKLGIYSSPNAETSGGYAGSLGHEAQDAKTWAAWGADYLKYDWSDSSRGRQAVSTEEVQGAFAKMRSALDATGRDIVYALTPYGFGGVENWGAPPVSANSWWTSLQVIESWQGLTRSGFDLSWRAADAGSGHWNDPGWLLVGRIGSASINPHFTKLTVDEQKTQLSLWSLVAAPLILSCDLTRLDPNRFYPITTALLTNDEVLDVDQDPLGTPGRLAKRVGRTEVWARPLEGGGVAVGLFNRGDAPADIHFDWADLTEARGGQPLSGPQPVRDLWLRSDRGTATDGYSASAVPPHGVVMLRIGKPAGGGVS